MCIFSWIGQNLVIVGEFMHEAWDWVNSNSGAIQSIIAVVAFVYAWKGYHKLLEQMKLSNLQRSRDSKMVFINLLHEAYRENIKYYQLGKKLKNIAKSLKAIDSLTSKEHATIDKYLQHLDRFQESIKKIKVELERIYELPDQLGVEDLEKYSFILNNRMKEFVRASNGFNVIELDLQKILEKYKN